MTIPLVLLERDWWLSLGRGGGGVGREVVHEGKVEVSKTLGFTEELIDTKSVNIPNLAHYCNKRSNISSSSLSFATNLRRIELEETFIGWTGQPSWGGLLWEMTDVLFQTLAYCLETTTIYFSRASFY